MIQEEEIELDPQTGMPVLPNGYVWSVNRSTPNRIAIAVSICMVVHHRVPRWVKKEVPGVFGIGTRTVSELVWETVEDTPAVEGYELKDHKMFYWTGQDGRSADAMNEQVDQLRAEGWTSVSTTNLGVSATRIWEPTQDNIVKGAKRCYLNWLYSQAERAEDLAMYKRGSEFLGIYPPKTLNAEGKESHED